MKIRNGFVSNSSSSSFIVAFPKKPKNVNDVMKFMFGDDIAGTVKSDYDDEAVLNVQVAKRVFEDISKAKKSPTIKDMAYMLSNRYYHAKDLIFSSATGKWSYSNSWGFGCDALDYFGTDIDATLAIQSLELDNDAYEHEYYKKYHGLIRELQIKNKIKVPKYGEEGYMEYLKIIEELKKNDPEYKKLSEERDAHRRDKWKKEEALRNIASKSDAKKFKKDNKGSFIVELEYGDGNGNFEATMEHGNIFRRLPHIYINNH